MTIGDFSRATHLSAKALRLYHQSGLLTPAAVDARNGYRQYAPSSWPTPGSSVSCVRSACQST